MAKRPARQHQIDYTVWLAEMIGRYDGLARALVEHHGEKGRVLEGLIRTTLRAILPGKVSIGSGFAVNHLGEMSPQLDIVLYDSIMNTVMTLEGGVSQ